MMDFNPKTTKAEIKQNIETTLHTRRGSVPLDRSFGVDFDFLDDPISEARLSAIPSAVEAIKKGDSRANLDKIRLTVDDTSEMNFVVTLEDE